MTQLTDEERAIIRRLAEREEQQAAKSVEQYRKRECATDEEWQDSASLIWHWQQEARIWRSIAQKMRAEPKA